MAVNGLQNPLIAQGVRLAMEHVTPLMDKYVTTSKMLAFKYKTVKKRYQVCKDKLKKPAPKCPKVKCPKCPRPKCPSCPKCRQCKRVVCKKCKSDDDIKMATKLAVVKHV